MIILKFINSVKELREIKQSIEYLLSFLKERNKFQRSINSSLVDNPFVKFYNKLLGLYYQIHLHLDNCKIYLDTMEEVKLIDSSFQLQLASLIFISDNLKNIFKELDAECKNLQRQAS